MVVDNKERALITYEILQKRKLKREKKADSDFFEFKMAAIKRCSHSKYKGKTDKKYK